MRAQPSWPRLTLITSQRPSLQIPARWWGEELQLRHVNFGGDKHSVYKTMRLSIPGCGINVPVAPTHPLTHPPTHPPTICHLRKIFHGLSQVRNCLDRSQLSFPLHSSLPSLGFVVRRHHPMQRKDTMDLLPARKCALPHCILKTALCGVGRCVVAFLLSQMRKRVE